MSNKKIPVGIQLYSVGDAMAGDVSGTLSRLAEMGYEGVEFAGYHGLAGEEMRKLLDENGLKCAGSHVRFRLLEGDALEGTVATTRALGTDRLIIPSAPHDDLDGTVRRMNAIHKRATDMGMKVGFHNHTSEFELIDGVTKFDRIFGETPEDFLVQLDIGWACAAGQDVIALLRRYAKRIETVHIKECHPEDTTAVVGEGKVDWPAVMDVLEAETAVQWYLVEQEQFAVSSMDSVKGCIENIRKIGR